MKYPLAIHKDKDSDFGVTVPDLPGCFSAGSSIEQAMTNAEEAILCHIEGLLEDSEPLPQKKGIEHHKANPDFQDATWAMIEVDLDKISGKSRRINITMPERVLSQLDEYVARSGENRSSVLAQAALEYVYSHKDR